VTGSESGGRYPEYTEDCRRDSEWEILFEGGVAEDFGASGRGCEEGSAGAEIGEFVLGRRFEVRGQRLEEETDPRFARDDSFIDGVSRRV
jgi:hypothetical protein